MARPTRVIAKHVVATDAISAPWFAICATSTMEAFVATAPPRATLAETLRELRRATRNTHVTCQYTRTHIDAHTHTHTHNDDDDETQNDDRRRNARAFASRNAHLAIAGAATTALDAERRAALRGVFKTRTHVSHAITHTRAPSASTSNRPTSRASFNSIHIDGDRACASSHRNARALIVVLRAAARATRDAANDALTPRARIHTLPRARATSHRERRHARAMICAPATAIAHRHRRRHRRHRDASLGHRAHRSRRTYGAASCAPPGRRRRP